MMTCETEFFQSASKRRWSLHLFQCFMELAYLKRMYAGVEQTVLGGVAHLLNFSGSDTMSAGYYAQVCAVLSQIGKPCLNVQ